LNFINSSGTDRPAVTAGARASDGNPNTAEPLPQEHVAPGPAEATVGFLQHRVLTVPSRAFLNVLAAGSAYVFARGQHVFLELAGLWFGRMSKFAGVGAFGTVLNLVIMSIMLGLGTHYLMAAVVATELTILSNFFMQERLVFRDMRGGRSFWQRFAASFGFNNIEALVRMPLVALLVELVLVPSVAAQALALGVAFLVRFAFTSRVIYRVRPPASAPVLVSATPMTPAGMETA
jgi:putative flippase GtrA